VPAGARGPAFLVTANYDVIKKYNSSDAYALVVAHLGDRLLGRAPIQASWPTGDKQLTKAEREEVQRLLKKAGHYSGNVDGRLGSGTREAVRRFQQSVGLAPPDGYPSVRLLARLRSGS
jgi:membrane-bound lytic murein transglycosylase B